MVVFSLLCVCVFKQQNVFNDYFKRQPTLGIRLAKSKNRSETLVYQLVIGKSKLLF